MIFEYTDPDGDRLVAAFINREQGHEDGPTVSLEIQTRLGDAFCHIPVARVEEVVAGIRDAARTATTRQTGVCGCGQPATPNVVHRQDGPCYMDQDGGLQAVELPHRAARQTGQQPDPTADDCPNCDHPFLFNGCTCRPWTTHGGVPRFCTPDDTVDMISGYERGKDCPHHRTAAGLDASQPATDPLVHVGWWCWRGDNHGHLATTACRSDNVPLHVPAEWADEMRAVIQHLTDDHDPGEDCTWLSPEDQAAEALAAHDIEETDQ